MTNAQNDDLCNIPTTFTDALKLTLLPVYPLQIVSKTLPEIQVSSDPNGLDASLLFQNELKLTDHMKKVISSQDVSFLSFELPEVELNHEIKIDKTGLSGDAVDLMDICEFPLQSAGKIDVDVEEMFPTSEIIEDEISKPKPIANNTSHVTLTSISGILENRESKKLRIKSEFSDILELILLKEDDLQGITNLDIYTKTSDKKVISLSTLVDLSRLINSYREIGSLPDLADKDDINQLCHNLMRELLQEEIVDLTELIAHKEPDSHLQTLERCLKSANILTAFLIAELKSSQSVAYLEDLIVSVCSFLLKIIYKIIVPSLITEVNRLVFLRFSENLQGFVQEFADILVNFQTVMSQERFPEEALTKLEFISLDILFVPSPLKNRIVFVKEAMFYSLKLTCMDVITCVYEHHRPQRAFIMDQVLNDIERLRIQDAANRNIKMSDGLYVQPLTALLLNFVQLSGRAELPNFNENLEKNEESFMRNGMKSVRENEHKASMNCHLIISHILRKIADLPVKTGESPFQTILGALADDLLSLLFIPDWPAAELMLNTMIWKLVDISSMDGDTSVSSVSLELIGRIASGLPVPKALGRRQKEIYDLNEEEFEQFVKASRTVCGYLKEQEELSASFQYFTTRFLNDLDVMTGRTVEGRMEAGSESQEREDEGTDQSVRLLSKKDQSVQSRKNPSVQPSETDDSNKPLRLLALSQRSKILLSGYDFTWSYDKISSSDAFASYQTFLSFKPIANCYDIAIRCIVYCLHSNRVNKRSKALKAISSLIQANLDIFSLKTVQESLCNCLVHNSISIRESAVDIVGKFILQQKQVIPDLFQLICDRSNDKGIAVRKRILKIMRDIFKVTEDMTVKITIADSVLKRLQDIEPSILIDSMNILLEMIFDNEDTEILRLLTFLNDKNPRLLSLFLSKCLGSDDQNDYSFDKTTIRKRCEQAIAIAIDELSSEENLSLLNVLAAIINVDGRLIKQDQLSDLEFLLDPNTSNFNVIHPILMIMRSSIEEKSNLFSSTVLSSLQELLLAPMVQYGLKELQEAARTLAAISNRKNDSQMIASILSSCLDSLGNIRKNDSYQKIARVIYLTSYLTRYCRDEVGEYLYSNGKTLKSGVKHYVITKLEIFTKYDDKRLRRLAIRAIGNICVSNPSLFFEKEVLRLMDKVMGLKDETIGKRGGKRVKYSEDQSIEEGEDCEYSDDQPTGKRVKRVNYSEDEQIGKRRKKTINYSEDDQPTRKRIKKSKYSNDRLQDQNDFDEQGAFLKVLLDLLTEEEKVIDQSLKDTASVKKRKTEKWANKIDVKTLKGTSESAAREGAAVGLVQRYMTPVLSIAMKPLNDNNTAVVIDALKLIRLVSKQGFAHPRSCVGVVMAVGSSKDEQLSSIARETLAILYSKYRSVIEGCYVDSIKTVYEYRRLIEPDTERVGEESLTVFYSVVKESKSFRQKFFSNLIKSLEFDPFRTEICQLIEHLRFSVFICTALSDLPLMTYGEVLAVIRAVEWHMVSVGTELWNRIEEEDEEEPDEAVGISAGILTVFWRLRIFISDSFNVSEERIQKNEKGRIARETKVSTRNSSAEPFSLGRISLERGLKEDLQRIEAFRRVMEESLNIEEQGDDEDEEY